MLLTSALFVGFAGGLFLKFMLFALLLMFAFLGGRAGCKLFWFVIRPASKGPGKRRHIVADTYVSPFARARNVCYGHQFCVRDTKNVSDFVQKHFVSATNVSQFAQPKKHHGQQCVRNNVSSFTRALSHVHFEITFSP